MMKLQRTLSLTIAILILAISPAIASNDENNENSEPKAKFTTPDSYRLKRALRFPLELPGLAVKVATSPLGGIFQVMEETHAVDRMADFMSNKDRTLWLYPIIGGGGGSGFGGGIGLRDTNLFYKEYDLNAQYIISTQLNQYASVALKKNDAFKVANRPVSYIVDASWRRFLNQDFYGIGNGSVRANQSKYKWNNIEGGATFNFNIVQDLGALLHFGVINADTGSSTKGGKPSVDTTFPANQIPGFGRRMTYLKFGVGVAHDTRDDDEFPESGGLRSFNFYRYQILQSGNFSYNEYAFDFKQYFQLWRPGLVIALHNSWRFEQTLGNDVVPFFRLSTLDVSSPLRGFKRGRFHDRASVLFNIEYWYPIWTMMKGIIFFDTGRVFPGVTNFSFSNFKYSAGGGFDIDLKKVIIFKFRAAYGGEGVNVIFGVSKRM